MEKVNEKRYLCSVSILKTALLLFIFTTSIVFLNAQQVRYLPKFKLSLQEDNPTDEKKLNRMLKKIVPTAYIHNAEGIHLSKSTNTHPVELIDVHPQFLEQVYIPNEQLSSAVLLKIRFQNIADLKYAVDLDKLKALPHLKYVYLLFEVDTDESNAISQILKGSNEQIVVMYNKSIPK